MDSPYTITRTDPRCMIVEWEGREPRTFLFRSDAHHDNKQNDRELELSHLKQAQKEGHGILDFGDLFCLMEGKWDPRKTPTHAREEYLGKPYYDAVMNGAVKQYAPFADNWLMMSPGNHETSFKKQNETDPTTNLVERINERRGTSIERMPYCGWVIFRAKCGKRNFFTMKLFYTHGSGGGGPVTRGTIQANRRAAFAGTADMLVSGHIHERWILWYEHDRCTKQGMTYRQEQIHICLPTYKREYDEGEGFHVERGAPPKPQGAFWVTLTPRRVDRSNNRHGRRLLEPLVWPAR